jgi:hypothetical protein
VTPNVGYANPQEYEPGHLGVREKNYIMAEKGAYLNSNSINYKHFANMKVTIYGNRLPRGTQVKKGREPLV